MLEVAEADYVDEPEETQAILKALEAEFGLTHRTVTDLLERARKESAGASDMFPTMNQRLDHEQKCRILTAMWRVAFADGNVDKYEEHLIRRVHELLHLDHSDHRRQTGGRELKISYVSPRRYASNLARISSRTRRNTARISSSLPVALAGSSKGQ